MILPWSTLGASAAAESSHSLPFATDILVAIGERINIDTVTADSLPLDTMLISEHNGFPVRVDVREGRIEHIGYRLFHDSLRRSSSSPALDFVERNALEEDLNIRKGESLNERLAHDKISFEHGDFHNLKSVSKDFPDHTVSNLNGKKYRIDWFQPGDSVSQFSMTFPISYDLLMGTDMKENERRLLAELSDSSLCADNQSPELGYLDEGVVEATWKPGCFVKSGYSIFSEKLVSERYYQPADSLSGHKFEPLYNVEYPVESIVNLLTGTDIPNEFEIELKMIAYPREPQRITIPLSRMVEYFKSRGCLPFAGVTKLTDSEAEFVVMYYNRDWGYCHSLKVAVDTSNLQERKGLAKARITPFVPIPKIDNLFYENQSLVP